MTKQQAENELKEIGAEYLKTEDRYGNTKTGWFLDGVWLSKNPIEALRLIK